MKKHHNYISNTIFIFYEEKLIYTYSLRFKYICFLLSKKYSELFCSFKKSGQSEPEHDPQWKQLASTQPIWCRTLMQSACTLMVFKNRKPLTIFFFFHSSPTTTLQLLNAFGYGVKLNRIWFLVDYYFFVIIIFVIMFMY